jgi:L-proline---[L-prolyl-carrier protein] ligase
MQLIHHAVLGAARRHPDLVALVDQSGPTSYRELARDVHGLARLIGATTGPGDRVAIASRKTSTTVLAMLATLVAGRSYVPVDPASPPARRDVILGRAGCAVLLTDQTAGAEPVDAGRVGIAVPVIDLADELVRIANRPSPADPFAEPSATAGLDRAVGPDDEAYLLFTSGSTGEPKGVVITHRNASAFVRWAAAAYPLRPGDQVAVHAPLHFDLPVYDLYVGLAGGATLHLLDPRTALFPQGLYRFLADRAISHLYAVPSALTALLNRSTLAEAGLPALRQLLYAGEEFRPRALAGWMAAVPGARVSNLYGPIETNVVTRWTVPAPPRGEQRIPLGHPVTGATVALLDDRGGASERAAAEGEIVVAGACVTPGYLNRPEQTERAMVELTTETGTRRFYRTGDFGRRDADGVLWLVGRRDGLVKTRGYRVELGEVEAVLAGHPGVAEVAVLAVADPELTNRLHALVVPAAGTDAGNLAAALTGYCRQRLPGYMVPGQLHLVGDLPRTSTGKLARAELGGLVGAADRPSAGRAGRSG